jgi:hypothetical protein
LMGVRGVDVLGQFGAYLGHCGHPFFENSLRFDRSEALDQEGDDTCPTG